MRDWLNRAIKVITLIVIFIIVIIIISFEDMLVENTQVENTQHKYHIKDTTMILAKSKNTIEYEYPYLAIGIATGNIPLGLTRKTKRKKN